MTGWTGAPAKKAPVLKGSKKSPLVVVPCIPPTSAFIAPSHSRTIPSQEQKCGMILILKSELLELSSDWRGWSPQGTTAWASSGRLAHWHLPASSPSQALQHPEFTACIQL